MVIFGPEIISSGLIKSCFKLGTKNKTSYMYQNREKFDRSNSHHVKKQNRYESFRELQRKLEHEEFKRPNHLFELRFETINKEHFVHFDMESVNNFTYELEPLNIPHITFACQKFQDREGKFVSSASTRLPSVPMVDALFCLMFAPLVQVIAEDYKSYFTRVICDGGELQVTLTHILTHHDLDLI